MIVFAVSEVSFLGVAIASLVMLSICLIKEVKAHETRKELTDLQNLLLKDGLGRWETDANGSRRFMVLRPGEY